MRFENLKGWLAAGIPLALVLGVVMPQDTQPAQSRPVAWVNTGIIMQQTPGFAQAESTFAREFQGYQSELARLQTQMDSAVSEFDRSSLVLSPTAREQREQELRDYQQDMSNRAQQLQLQAQRRERELMQPIEERVSAVIEGLRAERNIGLVFDVADGASSIVAADRSLDLTPTVVQRLRASASNAGSGQ